MRLAAHLPFFVLLIGGTEIVQSKISMPTHRIAACTYSNSIHYRFQTWFKRRSRCKESANSFWVFLSRARHFCTFHFSNIFLVKTIEIIQTPCSITFKYSFHDDAFWSHHHDIFNVYTNISGHNKTKLRRNVTLQPNSGVVWLHIIFYNQFQYRKHAWISCLRVVWGNRILTVRELWWKCQTQFGIETF